MAESPVPLPTTKHPMRGFGSYAFTEKQLLAPKVEMRPGSEWKI